MATMKELTLWLQDTLKIAIKKNEEKESEIAANNSNSNNNNNNDKTQHLQQQQQQQQELKKPQQEIEKLVSCCAIECMVIQNWTLVNSLTPLIDYLQIRLKWNDYNRECGKNYCFESITCFCKPLFEKKEFFNEMKTLCTILSKFIELRIPIDFDIDFDDDAWDSDGNSMGGGTFGDAEKQKTAFGEIHDQIFVPILGKFAQKKASEYAPLENQFCQRVAKPEIDFVIDESWSTLCTTLKCQTVTWSPECVY